MRAVLLFLIFIMPISSYGVGPEECLLSGKLNGKTIKLEYYFDEPFNGQGAYKSNKNLIYGYCTLGEESDFISCSTKKDGKPTVFYAETRSGSNTYICKTGCTANVVKQFILKCDDNC